MHNKDASAWTCHTDHTEPTACMELSHCTLQMHGATQMHGHSAVKPLPASLHPVGRNCMEARKANENALDEQLESGVRGGWCASVRVWVWLWVSV